MTSDAPSFDQLGLDPDILAAIESTGFKHATPVQAEGIPAFLTGDDILIQAQTGTGKTAAFVLPILQQLSAQPGTVQALVLAPTRELAKQVCGEFSTFGKERGIIATPIYGGTSFEKQHTALETAQVVVATPGRLLDLMRRKKFDPSGICFFGLDEADELLSMGFEKDVLDVVAQLPKKRQNFICSATINPAIQRVAQNFIHEPTIVNVSSDEIGAKSVRHEHFKVAPSEKLEALRRLIQTDARDGAIVFANTRAATFLVTDALTREDISVDVLNGELSQSDREAALGRMRDDSVQFLVATDVAARGIDISGLPAVINYDMPESPDVYIHRTGRTGRAGQAGVAYSLVCPSDISVFHQLQKFYHLEFNETSLPTKERMLAVVADERIDSVLEGLDADASLRYAEHLALAKRLSSREDGARVIAKLIAHFASDEQPIVAKSNSSVETAPAPEKAEKAETAQREPATEKPVAAAPIVEEETDEPPPRRRRTRNAAPKEAQPEAPQEEDAPETVEAPEAEAADTAVDGTLSADRLADALENASRKRGRWRGTRSLAKELEVDEDTIVAVLESDTERFEASRKKPGRWRLFADETSDDDQAKPEKRTEKAPREDDEPKKRKARSDKKERSEKPERKQKDERKKPTGRGRSAAPPAPKVGYVPLTLNIGSEHGADADMLSEELILLAGLDPEDVGRVLIEPEFSKVDVAEDYWEDMLNAIQGQTVCGEIIEAKGPRRRGGRRR